MEIYMRRALELATLGRGAVSPNPLVGCAIVHDQQGGTGRVIGEGWHQRYGQAHAERNAIEAVRPEDEHLLSESTAYVTLEPCSHVGKQPPCADLLIEKQIGRVVICNGDPYHEVAGRGIAKLRDAGIPVEIGLLADEGRQMNARFFTFVEQQRPYIILKWAETADGFIGGAAFRPGDQQVQISGPLSQRLVHRWRAEEDAILVGTNTARIDNPRLNVRLWPGRSAGAVDSPGGRDPLRIVLDRHLTLPGNLNLFDGSQPTLVLHQRTDFQNFDMNNVFHSFAHSLNHSMEILHQRRIQSVLVEGGAATLNSFLDAGLWDEIRLLRAPLTLGAGVKAPATKGQLVSRERIGADDLLTFQPIR
jgi:diaminohydroxyphosphoribosylaminopyrimidine deaminase / 5-amino-6-(5-phosphoribosylamino)uracil reductase